MNLGKKAKEIRKFACDYVRDAYNIKREEDLSETYEELKQIRRDQLENDSFWNKLPDFFYKNTKIKNLDEILAKNNPFLEIGFPKNNICLESTYDTNINPTSEIPRNILQEKMYENSTKERPINKDDLTNLKIALNTAKTYEDFLNNPYLFNQKGE